MKLVLDEGSVLFVGTNGFTWGENLTNISVVGKGAVNGGGASAAIRFCNCRDLRLADFSLVGSGLTLEGVDGGVLSNVVIEGIHGSAGIKPCQIKGDVNSRVMDVKFRNVDLGFPGNGSSMDSCMSGRTAWGIELSYVDNVLLENVELTLGMPDARTPIAIRECHGVKLMESLVCDKVVSEGWEGRAWEKGLRGRKLKMVVDACGAGPVRFSMSCSVPDCNPARAWSDWMTPGASFRRLEHIFEVPVHCDNVDFSIEGKALFRSAEIMHEFNAHASLGIDEDPVADAEIAEAASRVRLPAGGQRMLILGDSLSDFARGHNYADFVTHYIERKSKGGKLDIYNYGVGGDHVPLVLARLHAQKGVKRKQTYNDMWTRQYDIALVFLGHNDSKAPSSYGYRYPLVSLAEDEEGLRQIIGILRARGIGRIILMSATSSDYKVCKEFSDARGNVAHNFFGMPEHLERYNAVVRNVAVDLGCEYVDVYAGMSNDSHKCDYLRRDDGLHLTDAGNRYIAKCLLRQLMVK